MLRSELKRLFGPNPPPLWLRAVLFAAAYFLLAQTGNFLTPSASGKTYVIFWLPAGLYAAVLLLHAPRQWGWFIAAALPANLAFDLAKGTPVYLILAFYASNTVQATLGAWLVQTFVGRETRLRTVKEFFGFIGLAGIFSTAFGAFIGAGALHLAGLSDDLFQAVKIWWGSCAMAVLLFSPAVITWCDHPDHTQAISDRKRRRRIIEGIVLYGGLIIGTWVIFVMSPSVTSPYKFRTLPFLVWAGLRFGRRGAATANLIYAVLVVYSASHAQDLPVVSDLATSQMTFTVQTFLVVAALVGLVPAITLAERDQALGQLRESETHYRNLTEAAFEGVCISENGRLLDVSKQLLGMIGYERHEVLGRQIPEFIAPGTRAAVAAAIRREQEFPYLIELVRKDGRILNCEVRAKVVNSGGRALRMTAVRDITERVQAEEALRQSEEKFSKAFKSSPSSILITRQADGRILEANDTFCRRYEVPPGTAQGRTVYELGVWNNALEREALLARLEQEGSIRNFEKTGVLPSGRRFVSLLSLEKIKLQGEACLLTVTHDITDLKAAERALQENETKFRMLFNSANDAIFLMQGVEILDCNRMTEVLFGCGREQILGRSPIDFSPETQPDGESSAAKGDKKIAAVLAGEPQFFEWTHRRPDGTRFDAEVSLNRVELAGRWFVQAIVRDISPRKQTEITLKLLSQRLRLAAAAAAAAVWEWNLQTNDIVVDERMFALYGYPTNPSGRLSYEQWASRVHPEDLPEQEATLKQTVATKGQSKREFRIHRTDGTLRHVQAAEIVICDEHGEAVRMVGVNIDITERKTAEAALRESEERYRAVVEFSPDCIAVTVGEQIVYMNQAGAWMLGATAPTALVGKTVYDFAPTATHSAIRERRQRVLETGVASPLFETVMQRLDGTPVSIESQAVPFVYSGRAAVLYLIRDITARKQAEQQLQENQRMLTTLMANLPGMVYRCQHDADWTMQFVSDGCQALTGYRPQDLQASRTTNFTALTHPDDRDLVRQTVENAVQRRGVFEVNYRIRTAIGEEKWVWERGQGVFGAEGNLIALEGFITDITAQRQAEAEREAATKREQQIRAEFTRQLIASQEAERTRIAREIHDHLGQLLTALKLDLRSLERRASGLSDPELQTALLSKVKSAKELADETITSVQKIASELRPGILDRLGLAAAIEAEAQAFATRTGVSCPCSVPAETPPIPQDRAIATYRIFQEIMTNVARHAHATEVRIRLQLSATVLELEVADNGVGLAEEHFANPKSFGLLGMTERAEILGGQIEFGKPPDGSGTVVAVRLPLGETKLADT